MEQYNMHSSQLDLDSKKYTIKRFIIRLKNMKSPENMNEMNKENSFFADAIRTESPSNKEQKNELAADNEPDEENSLSNATSNSAWTSKPPERSVLTCKFCAKSFVHSHMQHAFICHYMYNTVFCRIDKCEFESKFVLAVQHHMQKIHGSNRKPVNNYEEHLTDIRGLTKECFPDWLEDKSKATDQLAKNNSTRDGLACNRCSAIVEHREHAAMHLNILDNLKCKRCAFSANLVQMMRRHYEKRHKEFYWKADVDTSSYAIAYKRIMKECFDRSPGRQSSRATVISPESSENAPQGVNDAFDSAPSSIAPVRNKSTCVATKNKEALKEQPEISVIRELNCCPWAASKFAPSEASVRVKEEADLPLFLDYALPITSTPIALSSTAIKKGSDNNMECFGMDMSAPLSRACSVTPEPESVSLQSVKPEPEWESQSPSPTFLPTPVLKRQLKFPVPAQNDDIETRISSSAINIELRPVSSTSVPAQPVDASVVAAVVALTQEIIGKQNQLIDILRRNNLFPRSE